MTTAPDAARCEPPHPPRCSACGHVMKVFFRLRGVPVNSCLLVDAHDGALAFPRGDIDLGVCSRCGFISNVAFDPRLTEYSSRYEETQAYSGTFTRFQEALASDLVTRLRVRGKTVVEVGCGKGEFLALLCRLGGNRGIGYDPSFDAARRIFDEGPPVRVVREFFGKGSGRGDGDLVCCKMTLEHIPDTADFAVALRSALRPGQESALFVQVPESLRILRECAFEDVYYEHCSYFTPGSLARLFRRVGFIVDRLATVYGGQYLALEGRLEASFPGDVLPQEEPVDEIVQLAGSFDARFVAKVNAWKARVEQAARVGPVVLWGSGSKAVAFLHAIDPATRTIEHVVDINPHRHGHYMPGTGQRILSPTEVRMVAPTTVIAMNPMYRNEVAGELLRQGIAATLISL